MPKIEASHVKEIARGRWVSIVSDLAPHLSPALERIGKHVDCPIHKGKNDFRLFKNFEDTGGGVCSCNEHMSDGFALIMWANCWDFRTTLLEVARHLGIEESESDIEYTGPRVSEEELERRREEKEKKQAMRDSKVRDLLNNTWSQTYSADSPQAEPMRLYLARRGLSSASIPPTLRFHPDLVYMDEDRKVIGSFPAIIAMVQDPEGTPVTLHRIYLTQDGQKAPVEMPKKLMPYPSFCSLKGAAIRLGVPDKVIGVAEGVETGLAVLQSTGMPVYVTISAALMEQLELPQDTEMSIVYADKDKSETGRNSAAILVQRLWESGIQATGMLPSHAIPDAEKGIDWLDVFNMKGPSAIPSYNRVRQLLEEVSRRKSA